MIKFNKKVGVWVHGYCPNDKDELSEIALAIGSKGRWFCRACDKHLPDTNMFRVCAKRSAIRWRLAQYRRKK